MRVVLWNTLGVAERWGCDGNARSDLPASGADYPKEAELEPEFGLSEALRNIAQSYDRLVEDAEAHLRKIEGPKRGESKARDVDRVLHGVLLSS
jgi:hypothetical protein